MFEVPFVMFRLDEGWTDLNIMKMTRELESYLRATTDWDGAQITFYRDKPATIDIQAPKEQP